jgi:hypothetical protein
MWEPTSGINFYGANRKTHRRSFNLEIMFHGFLKEKNAHLGKFKKRWFCPFRVYYYLPEILFLLFY